MAALDRSGLCLAGLNVAYNRKSELETQLPTAPEALLSTDECLTKSLISATAVLGKVCPLSINCIVVYLSPLL